MTYLKKNTPKNDKASAKTSPKKFDYEVEAGVEITGVRLSSLRDKFPFELMKPGDSFLIPAKDPVAKKPNTLHYAANQFAKMKPGFTLTSRMQLNGERRVWRIK